jgi:Fe-S-cluster containining protein
MTQENPQNKKKDLEKRLDELEHQIEKGNLFTHTIVSRNAARILEVESFAYGIIDYLIETGSVTKEQVTECALKIRGEMNAKGETAGPGFILHIEKENENKTDNAVTVNCSERLHVCKAVCCKLYAALTAKEVESGKIKWDLGNPYFNRHMSSGYCCHFIPGIQGCSIYKNRPYICRKYDCSQDKRIWIDFENLVFNNEWVNKNLDTEKLHLITAHMLPLPVSST